MIRAIIYLYMLLLVVDAVLSYVPSLKGHKAVRLLRKASDFTCAPIRKILPPDLPLDVSPLIVIVLLKLFVAIF